MTTLSAMGFLIAGALLIIVEVGRRRGYFGSGRQVLVTSLFPLAFLPLSVYCFALAKRGHVRGAARVYAWTTFVAIVLAAALFNGYLSATWILVFWPLALAGSLLSPIRAVQFAVAALAAYGGIYVVERAGWYRPPLPTAPAGFSFFALSFGWLMLAIAAGMVNYLHGRSLQGTLTELRETSRDLEVARRDLVVRVEQRTAELSRRAEQFRAIAELSQAAAAIRDPDELLTAAAALISRELDFYHVGIFMLDGGWAVLRAASSEGGQRMLARGHRLRIGQQGIVGYVAEMETSRYAFNVGDDAVWFNNPDLPSTKSEIALPLIIGARIRGVLDIQTEVPVAFGDEDVKVLRVLADGIAIAIQNARSLQEIQAAMERLERYQTTDVLQAWRRTLARKDLRVGYVYTDGETMRRPSGADRQPNHADGIADVTQQTTEDGSYLLLAPVRAAGRDVGVMSFERSTPWSAEAMQLVRAVVAQLDLALENARLLEETRRRAMQEAARGEIVGRIRATASTDAILRNAAEELGRALQVERSRIQLVPPEEM